MNHTTERFPRALRDDPSRLPDVFTGPYSRPRFFRLHAVVLLLTLAIAIAGTLLAIVGAHQP